MNCDHARKLMHLLLDDELDTGMSSQVETHISTCVACRRHYVELGGTVQKLSTVDWQKAPVDFTEKVMNTINREHLTKKNWRIPLVRWMGISAAAAFVFSLGVWWSMPSHFSVMSNQSEGLIVQENQVIVPKGQEYQGDLVIHNGNVIIEGKIDGNVITLNGQIYKQAGADISGKTQEMNESMQIIGYYLKQFWSSIQEILK